MIEVNILTIILIFLLGVVSGMLVLMWLENRD